MVPPKSPTEIPIDPRQPTETFREWFSNQLGQLQGNFARLHTENMELGNKMDRLVDQLHDVDLKVQVGIEIGKGQRIRQDGDIARLDRDLHDPEDGLDRRVQALESFRRSSGAVVAAIGVIGTVVGSLIGWGITFVRGK